MVRVETDRKVTVLADSFEGKKFNSPNDLAMDSQGRIYFTDPRYGKRDDMEILDAQGKPVEGVYRIDGPGRTRIIAHEVDRPNGILVSPDDRYLYVADNNNNTEGGARKIWRFDLKERWSIDPKSRKMIFDWDPARSGRLQDGPGGAVLCGRGNQPRHKVRDDHRVSGGRIHHFARRES